jgi:hypothetical protein
MRTTPYLCTSPLLTCRARLVRLVADALARGTPILHVAGQQLAPFAHTSEQRRALALPGRDVPFREGDGPDVASSQLMSLIMEPATTLLHNGRLPMSYAEQEAGANWYTPPYAGGPPLLSPPTVAGRQPPPLGRELYSVRCVLAQNRQYKKRARKRQPHMVQSRRFENCCFRAGTET